MRRAVLMAAAGLALLTAAMPHRMPRLDYAFDLLAQWQPVMPGAYPPCSGTLVDRCIQVRPQRARPSAPVRLAYARLSPSDLVIATGRGTRWRSLPSAPRPRDREPIGL